MQMMQKFVADEIGLCDMRELGIVTVQKEKRENNMKFAVKHELAGTNPRAYVAEEHDDAGSGYSAYYLENLPGVTLAKVYERTADAVICYSGDRKDILEGLQKFSYQDNQLEEIVPKDSGRELNAEYKEKADSESLHTNCAQTVLPAPVRAVYTGNQGSSLYHQGNQMPVEAQAGG